LLKWGQDNVEESVLGRSSRGTPKVLKASWGMGVNRGDKKWGHETSRHSLSTGNNRGENVALHGDTEGEGNDIEKEEVGGLGRGGLSREDTGLDGGTVGNSLVGVDALLELLATEEVAEELLDLGDTGGTTNKDDLVNLVLGNGGVLENLGNGVQSASEGLLVQVLETSTSNVGVEVLTVEQRVDLNSGLGGVGESTLGTLASSPETTEGTGIAADVCEGVSVRSGILEVYTPFFVFFVNSFLKWSRRLVSKS
jgi:hypothetical protein